MKIFKDIEAVEPYPVLYLESIDSLVISDLHLGYEVLSSEHGLSIPKIQFKKSMEIINHVLKKQHADRLIIVGDLKHEFSETSYHEYKEVSNFLEHVKRFFKEIILVRGNHDTFITRITRRYDVEVYDELEIGDYLFIHGHKDKSIDSIKHTVILGHEHPSIALYTEIGVKEKIKCFLYNTYKGKRIIVLPAFSYLAPGSDINLIPREELLSPILRSIDIDDMRVLGISEGDRFLEFPSIGRLRKLYYR
ncbi:MAG TPA: metallophosphoesterase [Thermoplasmatales archaeon]|nr:metallophosphoesterase [Thermoplasmatales archaeon]